MKLYNATTRSHFKNVYEMKEWFEVNYSSLPITLNLGFWYRDNLKGDVKRWLANFKKDHHLLQMVYKALQDKENWNRPPKKRCEFHNTCGDMSKGRVQVEKNPDIDVLISAGLFIDRKNKSIAVPEGFRADKIQYAALERLHKQGYLSIRATV